MKIKMLMVTALCYFMVGCTDKDNATKILTNEGYSNIEITGYDFFGCSEDDFQHTGFVAYKGNKKIEGTICSGILFKNSTIRFK